MMMLHLWSRIKAFFKSKKVPKVQTDLVDLYELANEDHSEFDAFCKLSTGEVKLTDNSEETSKARAFLFGEKARTLDGMENVVVNWIERAQEKANKKKPG